MEKASDGGGLIMTNREALEQLQSAKTIIMTRDKDWLDERDLPVLDCAIEALEKQIPKKFKMVDDCIPVCPVCGEEVWDMEWCNNCGQRLDVDEEE